MKMEARRRGLAANFARFLGAPRRRGMKGESAPRNENILADF